MSTREGGAADRAEASARRRDGPGPRGGEFASRTGGTASLPAGVLERDARTRAGEPPVRPIGGSESGRGRGAAGGDAAREAPGRLDLDPRQALRAGRMAERGRLGGLDVEVAPAL